jgi:hypothetical protein
MQFSKEKTGQGAEKNVVISGIGHTIILNLHLSIALVTNKMAFSYPLLIISFTFLQSKRVESNSV